jgi:hypothetical protein
LLLYLSFNHFPFKTSPNEYPLEIASNNKDLPAAIAANQNAGSALENVAVANSILGLTVTSKAAPVQTQPVDLSSGAAAAAVTSSATTKARKGTKVSAASATTTAATARRKRIIADGMLG